MYFPYVTTSDSVLFLEHDTAKIRESIPTMPFNSKNVCPRDTLWIKAYHNK